MGKKRNFNKDYYMVRPSIERAGQLEPAEEVRPVSERIRHAESLEREERSDLADPFGHNLPYEYVNPEKEENTL